MKNLSIFSILFVSTLFFACKQSTIINPDVLKSDIDKMPFSELVYEVSTDSIGNILDTISIQKIKKDENGEVIYKESDRHKSEITTKAYFHEDDEPFYLIRLDKNGDKVFSKYNLLDKNNHVVKSFAITYLENGDSTIATYSPKYKFSSDGKKLSSQIEMNGTIRPGTMYFTFNDHEDVTGSYIFYQGDTTAKSFNTYTYANEVMREKVTVRYKHKQKTWEHHDLFDELGHLTTSKMVKLDSDSSIKIISNFINDKDGNVLQVEISTYPANWKSYKKYIREKL